MNNFPKANSFDVNLVQSKIMGPNPLKLCEELLRGVNIAKGSRACDLGSGTGITSVMLAREYGLDVYAVDLWSDPDENRAFFREMSVPDERIHPVKANAAEGLPFEPEFFNSVVSIDSYNYFGRDPHYLGVSGGEASSVCEVWRKDLPFHPRHGARLPRRTAGMSARILGRRAA